MSVAGWETGRAKKSQLPSLEMSLSDGVYIPLSSIRTAEREKWTTSVSIVRASSRGSLVSERACSTLTVLDRSDGSEDGPDSVLSVEGCKLLLVLEVLCLCERGGLHLSVPDPRSDQSAVRLLVPVHRRSVTVLVGSCL